METFEQHNAAVATVFREERDGTAGLEKIREAVGEGPIILADLGAEQTAGYSEQGFKTYIIDPEGVVRAELGGTVRTRPDAEAVLEALAAVIEEDQNPGG
ncbi:MAG: hypothetical protein AAGA29_09590 [Planctomycetota bacterium]